ncbi:MAG TPA: hypothetical protein VJT81_06600 [Burkholderiales bacterium]|nr:hypothetical protein [Burkholderiales bacterium]
MVLLAAGSALVAGSSYQETDVQAQTQKVEVVRSFYFNRKPLPVGSIAELPAIFAREVIASNKAKAVNGDDQSGASQAKSQDEKGKTQKPLV